MPFLSETSLSWKEKNNNFGRKVCFSPNIFCRSCLVDLSASLSSQSNSALILCFVLLCLSFIATPFPSESNHELYLAAACHRGRDEGEGSEKRRSRPEKRLIMSLWIASHRLSSALQTAQLLESTHGKNHKDPETSNYRFGYREHKKSWCERVEWTLWQSLAKPILNVWCGNHEAIQQQTESLLGPDHFPQTRKTKKIKNIINNIPSLC